MPSVHLHRFLSNYFLFILLILFSIPVRFSHNITIFHYDQRFCHVVCVLMFFCIVLKIIFCYTVIFMHLHFLPWTGKILRYTCVSRTFFFLLLLIIIKFSCTFFFALRIQFEQSSPSGYSARFWTELDCREPDGKTISGRYALWMRHAWTFHPAVYTANMCCLPLIREEQGLAPLTLRCLPRGMFSYYF